MPSGSKQIVDVGLQPLQIWVASLQYSGTSMAFERSQRRTVWQLMTAGYR